jgi:hypothetical protein
MTAGRPRGFIALLFFVSFGSIDPRTIAQIDPRTIAQEVVGHDRLRMAMEPALLSVEQEKAQAAKPG